MTPNLFGFATKELSQDAVICWLIAWAGVRTKRGTANDALRACGRTLVEALFAKWEDWPVALGEHLHIEVVRQEHGIDVLARVDGRHVLLIEDKTDTLAHNDQLSRYWELVLSGGTKFGAVAEEDLFSIYFKTGNHSLRGREHADNAGYRVFDRQDLLSVLQTYRGSNAILLDFRDHVERWQRETESFNSWTADGEKHRRGWEGLFRWIEEECLANGKWGDDWGSLTSLVGGYGGLWIEPAERSTNSRFALWIQEDRLSFRLYGTKRKRPSVRGMEREKDHWANALVERGCGRLCRPRRMAATRTKPMCVAEWRGWLEFDGNGCLDKERSLMNVIAARRLLLGAIREGCG